LQGINELAPDYEKPIAAFLRAINLNSREPIYFTNLGHAYEEKGDWVKAEQAYVKSLGLKPGHVFSHRHLGLVLLELGRPREALEQAEKTLALAPRDSNLMMDIARCHAALKKKGEAKEWIKKAVLAGYTARGGEFIFDPYFQAVFKGDELEKLLEKKS
jgi:tetratricopeptide (TPR) repeat protein